MASKITERQITIYTATDGKEFDVLKDAQRHQAIIDLAAEIPCTMYECDSCGTSAYKVADAILERFNITRKP